MGGPHVGRVAEHPDGGEMRSIRPMIAVALACLLGACSGDDLRFESQ